MWATLGTVAFAMMKYNRRVDERYDFADAMLIASLMACSALTGLVAMLQLGSRMLSLDGHRHYARVLSSSSGFVTTLVVIIFVYLASYIPVPRTIDEITSEEIFSILSYFLLLYGTSGVSSAWYTPQCLQ